MFSYFFSPIFERKIVADKRSLFRNEQAFCLQAVAFIEINFAFRN